MTELDVSLLTVPDDKIGLFVMSVSPEVTQSYADRLQTLWKMAWRNAGHETAPVLIVMLDEVTLQALSDAEIKSYGLMRIPVQE